MSLAIQDIKELGGELGQASTIKCNVMRNQVNQFA
jgi:hypothetical protein